MELQQYSFSILNLVLYLYCMCSFDNSSNQALAKKLLTEVRAVYGKKKWMKSTIKGKPLSLFLYKRLFFRRPLNSANTFTYFLVYPH